MIEGGRHRYRRSPLDALVVAGAVLAGGAAMAYLVAGGDWLVGAVALAVFPAVVVLHRQPVLAVIIWLSLGPLVMVVEGGSAARQVYWLIHRATPPGAVLVAVVTALLGLKRPKAMKLGLPEALMLAYLAVSLLSIWYTSFTPGASTIHLYDRVLVPMSLYLLVRLAPPRDADYQRAVPVLAFLLASQALFGILAWLAPHLVPSSWLDRADTRTVGSLDHPNVYGTTVLIASVWLFYLLVSRGDTKSVRLGQLSLLVGTTMAFLTFSRATWLAALAVLGVLFLMYRRPVTGVGVAGLMIVSAVLVTGVAAPIVDRATTRFFSEASEESALSRLPVVVASLRMFEAKPIVGWGFGNFDRYDIQFQGSVADLFVPDKDHASHNLYLTILAEQGAIGFITYMGPAVLLLLATPRAYRRLARHQSLDKRVLVVLWMLPLSHLVVNNLSNMRVPFGLGLWWLSLGLIANTVARAEEALPDHPSTAFVSRLLQRTGARAGL